MKPHYTLPPSREGSNITLATKPRQVGDWLAALPFGNPGACAERLADYLNAHNRPDLPPAFRRQFLAQSGNAAERILGAIEADYHPAPLPLTVPARRQADRALRLLLGVADFLKRLILDHSERRSLFGENPMPELLVRHLATAGRILDHCYATHSDTPAGIWLESHQTYYYALEQGLADAVVAEGRQSLTPGGLYRSLLLEAIADPYRLSDQERLWTRDIVARHAGQAQLVRAEESTRGGVYGVRIDEDRPPRPLSWHSDPHADHDLILNNTQLARRLALLANRLEHGGAARLEGEPPGLRPPAYKALLQQLKRQWGGSLIRHSPRRPLRHPVQCQVTLGFHPIYRALLPGHCPGVGEDGEAKGSPPCRIVNESLGGLAIEARGAGLRLAIGTLVGVRREGEPNHGIGLVRWFRTTPDGLLTFGVRLLTGRPDATRIHQDDAPPCPGLLLAPERGEAGAATLIAPALAMERPLVVDYGRSGRADITLEGRLEPATDAAIHRCRIG